MHTALLISEIVELICLHSGPDPPSWRPHSKKRDVANLAMTSTLFLDHALDVLWECQNGLANILKCMPEDLWDGPIRSGSLDALVNHFLLKHETLLIESQNAVRPITAADWERPLFYLSRVRKFHGGRSRAMGSNQLSMQLCSSLPTTHWFPNLRFLEWSCYEPVLLPAIGTLIAPRTSELRLIGLDIRDNLSLLTLKVHGGRLTDVYIGKNRGRAHGSDANAFRIGITPFIRSLERLQRFHIEDFDQEAFRHLAILPDLKSLKIAELGELNPLPSYLQLVRAGTFCGLQELEIATQTVWSALAVLTSISGPLTSLNLQIKHRKAPLTEVSQLFATLGSMQLPLRSLRINIDPDIPNYYETMNGALEYLFVFRSLEELSLEVGEGWDLDDTVVLTMARAWPNIIKLHMRPDPPTHIIRRVTLAGLRAFALHCHKLSDLSINVDARVLFEELPASEDAQRALTALHVGYSPISNIPAVATLLFAMYPQLSLIVAEENATPDWRSASIHDDTDGGTDVYKLSRMFCYGWGRVQGMLKQKRQNVTELQLEAKSVFPRVLAFLAYFSQSQPGFIDPDSRDSMARARRSLSGSDAIKPKTRSGSYNEKYPHFRWW
jgi:hypothetical protein